MAHQVFNPLSGTFDLIADQAEEISYDNNASGLTAVNVQEAVDELQAEIDALPDPITYKGTWSAATNTPTLSNTDVGATGFLYQCIAAGSVNFGAGAISFEIGDKVVNDGSAWQKWDMTDAVASVNGQTGVVVLTTTDIAEGTNEYFTNAKAQAAITGGASTIVTANLTASRALQSSAGGKVEVSAVTATELGYVSGVTSSIQTQIGTKMTNPMTVGGQIIYGGASGVPTALANGTAGQYFRSSGGTSAPTWSTFTPPTIQSFTSGSGTYTTPVNVKYIRVRMWGGGGGGGPSGTSGGSAGTGGGNTTFGAAFLTANGGGGGTLVTSGGGGAATISAGATGIALGGTSGDSWCSSNGLQSPVGGSGAGGPFGGGGRGTQSTGGDGTANSGSGGGGAGSGGAGAYGGGGGGAGGFIDVIVTPVSATYAYSVGTAGSGGGAGVSGNNGGAGALGYIEVTEYYQ